MNKKGLLTEKLQAGYERKVVLDGVDLVLHPGEIMTLIGPNGSGKSTLLKTIVGQLKPQGGALYVDGEDAKLQSGNELAKKMSVVLTGKPYTEHMTCYELAATGRYPYTGRFGLLTKEDEHKVYEALRMVGAAELKSVPFEKISDGQRQRVLLARALCQEPGILVLDEPTSYLDIKYKADILTTIAGLAKEKNIAVIMSLHELELAKAISDVLVCVGEGKIVKKGTPEEIFRGDIIAKLFGVSEECFDVEHAMLKLSFPKKTKEKMKKNPSANRDLIGKKTKVLMVQGTMSNAGKSLLVAGLCRVFKQDGYRVAPFKSQNMALNSYITKEGLEMGRAQVMQAEAAGMEPEVSMNPILLKPTSDKGSQVIVNGKVLGNMPAREYFAYKKELIPEIIKAYENLAEKVDIIVIEGAGSPAEINLKQNDIVNMGLAHMVDAPVLLVGDIDRGGVFAQLLGTLLLLEPEEKARVKGLVINKFRGDKTILDPGIEMLEERGQIPVMGVIPYMQIQVDDEDSLSTRFEKKDEGLINIKVVRLPRISNFSDFSVFERIDGVVVHYTDQPTDLESADLVILPGSKNTIADMQWMRACGMEAAIKKFAKGGKPVIGICGGYQMLGQRIEDPEGVEIGGSIIGMELLPTETILREEKTTTRVSGAFEEIQGYFSFLSGKELEGYEIHMGETAGVDEKNALASITVQSEEETTQTKRLDGTVSGCVMGSYIHGLFDLGDIAYLLVERLAKEKGVNLNMPTEESLLLFKERQYDLLAATIREHMDMDAIYKMLEEC